jgi:hypothetical protein
MANERLTWEELAAICPKESAAIADFLDKWGGIELNRYFHGAAGDMDWCKVVDLRDLHLKIKEFDEAQLEKQLVEQCQVLWYALRAAYEEATKNGPLCRRIVGIGFGVEFGDQEKPYFLTELGPAILSAVDLVTQGENECCEFKSTLRKNLHTGSEDKRLEHACLKTIAAFLNTDGGHLLIGVNDRGEPLGIDNDRFPSEDQMNLHLFNLLRQRIGAEHLLNVEARFETLGSKRVLLVHCRRSNVPVCLKNDNTEQFFIRTGAASVELLLCQALRYIKQRFHDTD